MSQVKLIDPVESLQGKMSRKVETIFRYKHYRDANDKIITQGAQEAYVIAKPRDRKKNPPVGAEKRQIDLFAEASRRTTIEIAPDSPCRFTANSVSMPISLNWSVPTLHTRTHPAKPTATKHLRLHNYLQRTEKRTKKREEYTKQLK